MSVAKFDVAVIGGGPGGYVAAIRAAQLGMRTVLIEREHLGGVCSNWGCIPTKALLHGASLYRQMKHASAFGLKAEGLSFDLSQLVESSRKTAGRMNNGVRYLLKKNKVELVEGQGRLMSRNEIEVSAAGQSKHIVSARHVILATGARPREIPALPVDGSRVWNYRHALVPRELPESLLVVGAGAIGMEFASFYSTLGTRVTVVEAQQRVLPMEDSDVSAFVQAAFEKQGVTVHTGTAVDRLEKTAGGLRVILQREGSSGQLEVGHVLVSVGVCGNIENLGLENTQVKIRNGYIATDAFGQTSDSGIYAIGDVAGPPWLAHKASHEAVICIENIADPGRAEPLDRGRIPACTYTHPQVASIGLTEEQAKQQGRKVRIGRFPFTGNGKATAMGETEGFVKTIFDQQTGELLGAHLVGPEVTELIHGFAIAKTLEATEAELMHTVFPHPTLSEAAHESVLMAFDRALHV